MMVKREKILVELRIRIRIVHNKIFMMKNNGQHGFTQLCSRYFKWHFILDALFLFGCFITNVSCRPLVGLNCASSFFLPFCIVEISGLSYVEGPYRIAKRHLCKTMNLFIGLSGLRLDWTVQPKSSPT